MAVLRTAHLPSRCHIPHEAHEKSGVSRQASRVTAKDILSADLDKDGQQYMDLARSGRVWEDYHQPSDSVGKGYMKLQDVGTSL